MSDNFKRNTISGLKWTFLDYFVVKGISFATNIILARMLSPKEFGIMGAIAIIIAMANTMVDAGLTS
ncbi:oligosaccharide flippase family protein, partial [Escherichia coli]|nr:oligosaccharide flippase family protein [Escherichia coli]